MLGRALLSKVQVQVSIYLYVLGLGENIFLDIFFVPQIHFHGKFSFRNISLKAQSHLSESECAILAI